MARTASPTVSTASTVGRLTKALQKTIVSKVGEQWMRGSDARTVSRVSKRAQSKSHKTRNVAQTAGLVLYADRLEEHLASRRHKMPSSAETK